MSEIEHSTLLYQALASPFGLELRVSNIEAAKQRLYAARRSASDPALDCLQFRVRNTEILWITKHGVQENAFSNPG